MLLCLTCLDTQCYLPTFKNTLYGSSEKDGMKEPRFSLKVKNSYDGIKTY